MDSRNQSVVVVGAGLGGLSAAISLRAEGFDVRIVEKNDKIGGKLNYLEKEGFGFDLGPSIFTLPQIFRDLFERAGKDMDDYVTLEKVKPHWRNFFEDGTEIDLYEEEDLMKAELGRLTGPPEENWKQFQDFLDYARAQYQMIDEGYFSKGLDTLWEFLRHYNIQLNNGVMDYRNSMSSSIKERLDDPHLRMIFEYFIKYVGSSAHDAPGYMNLMPIIQFDYGLWYVKGGMYNLARGLGKLCQDMEIPIDLNCEVSEITKKGFRKVSGVKLASGEEIKADYVVCNMEVIPAYGKLLRIPEQKLARVSKKFAPACSGLVIHLGTDRQYPQLAHHNFFYSKNQDKHFDTVFKKGELPEDPTIYLVAPTRTDVSKAPKDCDNIKILPHIPPIDPDNPLPESAYMNLKDRVIDKLERMGLTGLREHTIVEDILTPTDLQRMYNSNRGSIYGVVSDWKRNYGFKFPKQSSKFSNLYFTGGSVNPGGGMPMVVLCGQKVADRILKRK
ncbi:MAG: phytoene desaturase family protein [Verrucomicrobiales bacterium]|nr:phytoene desaturase family protein [Verrucomicrobiales bacterium]